MCSWCGDEKGRRGIKGCSLLWGHGLASWIISAVAECRFSPPLLTSGLDSSAHIHLFNLRKLHLTSYIVHWVKEQWVPLYPVHCPSKTIRHCSALFMINVLVTLWPYVFDTHILLFCNYLIMVFEKSISCWLPASRATQCLSSGHVCPVIVTGCLNSTLSQWGSFILPTQPINKLPKRPMVLLYYLNEQSTCN